MLCRERNHIVRLARNMPCRQSRRGMVWEPSDLSVEYVRLWSPGAHPTDRRLHRGVALAGDARGMCLEQQSTALQRFLMNERLIALCLLYQSDPIPNRFNNDLAEPGRAAHTVLSSGAACQDRSRRAFARSTDRLSILHTTVCGSVTRRTEDQRRASLLADADCSASPVALRDRLCSIFPPSS